MRALATRSQSLALGIAVLTAAALGTVGATAAQASGTSTTKAETGTFSRTPAKASTAKPAEPPRSTGFGVSYHPTTDAPDDLNAANDDFAACMKEQGRSVFPDFEASKGDDGGILLKVGIKGSDFDPTSKSFRKALKACAPILAKAGITFPDPADLPPLPTPGKPGKPGKPGEGLPSLTESGFRTA
ncbi:hypothetical protein ACWD5F_34520 [Streptomyces sp. NPDC002499]